MAQLNKKEEVWVSDNDLGPMFEIYQTHISLEWIKGKWQINAVRFESLNDVFRYITRYFSVTKLMIFVKDSKGDYRYLIKAQDLKLISAVSCFDKGYKIEEDKLYKELVNLFIEADLSKVTTQVAVYPNKHNENYSVC